MSTAPFSASSWKKIHACGQAVEASLARSGVALTMGGEPTFVPIQPFGAEWQTAALGPTKLAYARRFAHAYVRAAHPGAVILETSGKHYPGEPLPRWTLLVQRRADGVPAWRNLALLAADTTTGTHTPPAAKTAPFSPPSPSLTTCPPRARMGARTQRTPTAFPAQKGRRR